MERNNKVTIRLTNEEFANLQSDAQSVGISMSEYIRLRVSEGITQIFYDPETTTLLQSLHDDIRQAASAMQECALHSDGDLPSRLSIKACEDHLRSIRIRFAELEDVLNDIKRGGN